MYITPYIQGTWYSSTPGTRVEPTHITSTGYITIGVRLHFYHFFIGNSTLKPSSFNYSRAALSKKYQDCGVTPNSTRDMLPEVARKFPPKKWSAVQKRTVRCHFAAFWKNYYCRQMYVTYIIRRTPPLVMLSGQLLLSGGLNGKSDKEEDDDDGVGEEDKGDNNDINFFGEENGAVVEI